MASTVQDTLRRRARADVVAITMGRGRFRMLVLVGVLLLGGAFGGGVLFGRRMVAAGASREMEVGEVAAVERALPPVVKERVEDRSPSGPGPGPEPEPGPGRDAAMPQVELARIGGAAPPPKVDIREDVPDDGFGLQLGAYPSREEAERFVQTHAGALGDRRVHIIATEVPNKGTWYRVRVGHFDSKRVAKRARRGLTEELRSTSIVVSYR